MIRFHSVLKILLSLMIWCSTSAVNCKKTVFAWDGSCREMLDSQRESKERRMRQMEDVERSRLSALVYNAR